MKNLSTQFIAKSLVILFGYFCFTSCFAQQKPNIVWIMAEDIGTDLACYGRKGLQTPNLDNLAAEGMLLARAYTNSPICSPSRSSMMTGMYQNSIDCHNHRSHTEDGYKLPQPITTLTSMLRKAGYYTSNGNGYNKKTDMNFNLREGQKPLFDGKDWSERQTGQPFYAQITLYQTHRNNTITNWENIRKNSPDPVNVNEIELPPYLPDRAAVRYDWALYLDQMEHVDKQVGQIVQRLKNENLLDNTMVIFIGDNGRCQVRGKCYLYECGIHVPAIIRYPAKISAGTVSDELVPMLDMVAQILHEAEVVMPSYLQGRPFLESTVPDREFIFAARDRAGECYDKSRSVVGKRFKLIRNDMPLMPYDANSAYMNNPGVRPILPLLRTMYANGELNEVQAHFFRPEKPALELYDLENDPWEIKNLADSAAYADMVDSLMKKITEWEHAAKDLGRIPEDPNTLPASYKAKFDANVHMQKCVKSHKITIRGQQNGTVKASYCGLKDVGTNLQARYGFEIYLDATPESGYIVRNISSDDVKGTFDSLNNRYIFFMPLKAITVDVEFAPATLIKSLRSINRDLTSSCLTKGKFRINGMESHESLSKISLHIYTISGRQVHRCKIGSPLIDLTHLSPGMYLYSLTSSVGVELYRGRLGLLK